MRAGRRQRTAGGKGRSRTASCFSLFPSVVRIVVSFASSVLYCAASVSFSCRVRASSRCSRSTGSSAARSSSAAGAASPLSPVVGDGDERRSVSDDVRAPLVPCALGSTSSDMVKVCTLYKTWRWTVKVSKTCYSRY